MWLKHNLQLQSDFGLSFSVRCIEIYVTGPCSMLALWNPPNHILIISFTSVKSCRPLGATEVLVTPFYSLLWLWETYWSISRIIKHASNQWFHTVEAQVEGISSTHFSLWLLAKRWDYWLSKKKTLFGLFSVSEQTPPASLICILSCY